MNITLEDIMNMAAPAPVHKSSYQMPKKRATELRTHRANTLAFIEKCGGIERAADALLSTPTRSQHWANIREVHTQGAQFNKGAEDAEDAMDCLSERSIDVELIALEEAAAEPELPKLQGELAAIFILADAGRSPQQIADALGLCKRRINQILADVEGIKKEVKADAVQASFLPPLTSDDIRPRTPIKKPRKPRTEQRQVTTPTGQGVLA